ncbi:MAG: 30S ribosomal protein S8 [Gammaproteobacteria bacterium]
MSYQDPISDCLTRIRNGLSRGKKSINSPFSKLRFELVTLLVNEGYLKSVERKSELGKNFIQITLKYNNSTPAIRELKRVSKPSLRRYSGANALQAVKNGLGVYVLSTSQGLMTDKQAKSKNIGGEILCEVF